MEHFRGSGEVQVRWVVSNKPGAPVIDTAHSMGVETLTIDREGFYHSRLLLEQLKQRHIEFIALAGFLWLVPDYLVQAFSGRIINIHPALLPQYGGKGMYGMHVHETVKKAGDAHTGITIHYVNEHYDEGQIIFQARCPVEPHDSPADIARKVQALEHRHFPAVLEQLLLGKRITGAELAD